MHSHAVIIKENKNYIFTVFLCLCTKYTIVLSFVLFNSVSILNTFCFLMNIMGKKVVCTLFIHGTQILLLCLHLCSDFKSFMAASCLSVIVIIADEVYFVLHHYTEV